MSIHCHAKAGFTLLEMLISLAIIASLSALSFPFISSFQKRNDLEVATNTAVQTIRRAQSLSMASEGDSTWGLSVISGDIVLYKGANYAARDTTYDEKYSISTGIAATGVTDVSFAKLTGVPSATGTLTLTGGDTKVITINGKGVVNY